MADSEPEMSMLPGMAKTLLMPSDWKSSAVSLRLSCKRNCSMVAALFVTAPAMSHSPLASVCLKGAPVGRVTAASGLWLMAGAGTNNAATIEQVRLQLKRSGTAEDFQSESINSVFAIPGNIDISGDRK